jgi:flavin-dependent dehydrogenase
MSHPPRHDRHDVVVVGAGPAGAHLAIRLARAGHSVAVLDRRRFPRAKPCGEFMSPECIPLLEEVGLRDAVLAGGARRIHGMRLHGHGAAAEGRFVAVGGVEAPFDHGYALRREVLDQLAVEAARSCPGVTLLEAHAVVDLVRDGDGRVLGVEALGPDQRPRHILGSFTVGADGLRSRVARALGVQVPTRWLDKFAVVARFAEVPMRDHAEVHFFDGGYLALAPVDGGQITLNMVIDRSALPRGGRRAIEDALQARIAATPALGARLAGRDPVEPLLGCGPLAGRTRRQVFDGAALVGDACGYVDPVTGEGLFFAMRGAALLADALVPALAAGRTDRAALRGYARARRREFGPRLWIATLLQRGLRHPRLVRRVLRLLEARPRLADLLVATTGDYVSPRALLRPSVWIDALRTPAPRSVG